MEHAMRKLIGIEEAPKWLFDLATTVSQRRDVPDGDGWITERIPQGSRNNTLTRIAGYFRRKGFGGTVLEKLLQTVNQEQCEPPLDTAEVARIAASVERYPPSAPFRVEGPDADAGGQPDPGDNSEPDDESADESARQLPDIVVSNRPLGYVTADAIEALEAANYPPQMFQRSGTLCRFRFDETGRPVMEQMSESHVRHEMVRSAYYLRRIGGGTVHVIPSSALVRDVLACRKWPFPPLQGIVETPVLRRDGSLLSTPGYDPATRLIYVPAHGLRVPEIPERPTAWHIAQAKALIDELIGDFPFVDAASKANAIAAFVSVIVRPVIDGPVPLGLIDAPMRGTGKGLLAECISYIPTGRNAALMTAPTNEEEWRKQITAQLIKGGAIITIDNLEGKFASPNLAAALTASTWEDRILGRSEIVALPQLACWFATGNNIQLGGDIPRRCYLIRLDAKTARPCDRTGFRHPDLHGSKKEHRGELIAALLTLARNYFASETRSYSGSLLGSYESWSQVVGGILEHAGITGFRENVEDMQANNDSDEGQWEAFFAEWYTKFGERPVTVGDIIRGFDDNGYPTRLREAIPDWLLDDLREPGRFRKRLGEALSRQRDAIYGSWRLERAGKARSNVSTWRVVEAETATKPRACAA